MSAPAKTTTATTTAAATPVVTPAVAAAPAATPDLTGTTLTSDVYSMLVGGFMFVLTVFVLISTGSIMAVLVLWTLIALILLVLVYYGMLDIDKLLGPGGTQKKPEKPVTPIVPIIPSGGPLLGSEVFHISDSQFTYDEAPAVCAAYGAELATLEQIMDAYSQGAEWCGYGWSAGGMALYPTQKKTWEELQREIDPGKRTRCGRPGVNGGYFDPALKFGVNCFGFKPQGKFTAPAPVPGTDSAKFKEMVARFKDMIKSFTLDPYSRREWSGYDSTAAGKAVTYGTQFKQDLGKLTEGFTPGDPSYVEPISAPSMADSARPLQAPYGLRGDVGQPGAPGKPGSPGAPGTAGAPGTPGAPGPRGEKGEKGDLGPMGPRGLAGTAAAAGAPGQKGDVGPMGPRGLTGAVGAAGPAGAPGAIGPMGPAGPSTGKPGPAGPAGPAGTPGAPGAPGAPGKVGGLGPAGPAGPAGAPGAAGTPGAAGPAGPAGPMGTVPKNLSVDSVTVGDWKIETNRGKTQPGSLSFFNIPNNHLAGQMFSLNNGIGIVRATTKDGKGYHDIWS